ncbi:GNAT family N-acetyltransferase [Nonomuraea sp. NPDC050394]|uniref:GNAT family N-acetyltransferase n=1 Tax=Nonomuraea sp. NPDC050394 TaxID=3364363 RepID=UPI0037B76B65
MDVSLRPVREDDLPFLNHLTNDQEGSGAHQWYGWHDPHHHRRRWEENGFLTDEGGYLIITRAEDRLGFVSWHKQTTSRVSYCYEMGLIVASEFRGRGYGTHAQQLLVRYLFDHSTVNRIQAATELSNLAEQRALEKAGFTKEGVLRGIGFRAGRWQDGVLYSILRADLN